jgi:hypothetical protein
MSQTKYSISTYNGDFFDFNNTDKYHYDIETIAHALSNICRYGGHSNRFYSVAEHSVLVSTVVPPELALCGLLHDASEAFVGDMPSPLKALCQSYRTIEQRVQESMANQFGFPYPFPPEIKAADKAVYKAEREQITSSDDKFWHTEIVPANVIVNGYPPSVAKAIFLSRYLQLIEERKAA